MVNKSQEEKPEGFKAFSNMKMQSLWDTDKVKAAHSKNLETLKRLMALCLIL